ncbi:outer membrane protein [Bosea sp. (in: a-proteobacteria)]|uniref:outer membrane protein n=1 Tax=Bosea sp. (in: a-proteobacteria) TaxID=1871050 RepID=UPI002FC86ACD
MKKILAVAAAAAVLGAGAAMSADLPSRKYAPPPPVAPVFSWTGFYVGANAGYSWNQSHTRYDYALADREDFAQFNALGLVPMSLGSDADGFLGGGQIGYNYQIGRVVVGVEADLQYLDARQSSWQAATLNNAFSSATITTTAQASVDWLGTLRLRAGYEVFDRTLVYATGGLAYGRTKNRTTITSTGFDDDGPFLGAWSGSKHDNRVGWALGAGVEYAITNNLTLKGEYLYYDLGRTRYVVAGNSNDPDDEFLGANARRKTHGHVVRAGLNWKFSTF